MSERWIVIPKWNEFQHYRDREPTWIKNYIRLTHDDAYLDLALASRGVLHGVWLLYGSHRGVLSDARARALLATSDADAKYFRKHLRALTDAGLIELSASKPTSESVQIRPGFLPLEEEKERDYPLTPTSGDGGISPEDERNPRRQGTNPRAAGTSSRAQRIDLGNAWALFLTGHGWDETYDEGLMLEELARLRASPKTTGKLTDQAALERWQHERDRRYPTVTAPLAEIPF